MTGLLVTPKSLGRMETLTNLGADVFVIGEQKFGLRLPGEFNRQQMTEAAALAHKNDRKVYTTVNGLFHSYHLDAVKDYINFLHEIRVNRAILEDPAVVIYVKTQESPMPLHWNTETLATNHFQYSYWGKRNTSRAVLAHELNLGEIINIKGNSNVETEVRVQGMACMFQSERILLGNYYTFQDRQMRIEYRNDEQSLLLYDEERQSNYPVYEDYDGTHTMSPNDICLIEELAPFSEAGIDSFKIDGILQTEEYINVVTEQYRQAIDLCNEDPEIYEDEEFMLMNPIEEVQPDHRPFNEGFLCKQTVH